MEMYELVFLLSLHDTNKINSIDSLFNQVCPESEDLLPDITEFLRDKKGKNVLVIIDGIDLILNEDGSIVHKFLRKIIYGELYKLDSCDLIISSCRPHSCDSHNCTRVELLGFTEDLKHQCMVQNSQLEVKKYLKCNTFLNSLCYHPFFLGTLFSLLRELKLPNCETAVIDRLVCCMIANCTGVHYYVSVIELYKELQLEHEVCIALLEISKLAYNTESQTFEIKGCTSSLRHSGLGLLKPYKLQNKYKYSFINHTLQEFLIAFNVSTWSRNEQEKFRKANMWSSKYLNVWFHYCGLVKSDDNVIKISLSGSWYGKLLGEKRMSKILQNKIKCLYLIYCFMQSPEDFLYRQTQTKVIMDENILDISNSTLTDDGFEIIDLYLYKCIPKQWKCLNLSNCSINNEQLVKILNLLKHGSLSHGTFSIDIFNIADNNIELNEETFSSIINTPNINQCILSYNKIKDKEIIDAVLSLSEDQFNDNFPRNLLNYNSLFLFSISPHKYADTFHSTTLVNLYLIKCDFNSEEVDFLCNVLKSKLTLSLIFLYDNNLHCSEIMKVAEVLKLTSELHSCLLYEKSLSDKDVDDVYQTLGHILSISTLMVVNASKIQSLKVIDHQIITGFTYITSVTHIKLRACHISHKVMSEMATLLNNSTTPINVLELSGSTVDDIDLGIFCNTLDPGVRVESACMQGEISTYSIAELVCNVNPSMIDISGSLSDSNKQSVGMVVAENLFTSRRQSTVMLTCDNEKVGIFHKLDYSSCIAENASQLTQLFINNCTIDGKVLANSLDNNESVVLLHLSNMKWDGEVFYTTNSFVTNTNVVMSVCESSLPDNVIQDLLNAFTSGIKISRIISTDDVFIAHSCSYELLRWHLTQEKSCDSLELFYMCNCTITTGPDWWKMVASYLNCKKVASEVNLHGNDIATGKLHSLLLNTLTEKLKCYILVRLY